jgi:tellurite resistance protein TerC
MPALFPLAEYWWFYLCFTAFIMALLALDLGLFHRKAHEVPFREALVWGVVWVALALAFNYLLYRYALWKFPIEPRFAGLPDFDPQAAAGKVALEFLAGYIVEYSLSVDNMFVFLIIFQYFAIPPKYQHRVLFYGIVGALVLRALFIAAGAVLMRYHWVTVAFGVLLIYTAIKMATAEEAAVDPDKSLLLKLVRRVLPTTRELHLARFVVRIDGRLFATPLLVSLLFLEFADMVFALDSVPAIFGITKEPLVVFTSNMFAILGLRTLYFLLAGAAQRFHLLKYGVAAVLLFVGLKMVWLNGHFEGQFPISWSLAIIGACIGTAVAASILVPPREASDASN